MVVKIKTGIKELDKILYGGLVKNSIILLSGYPGTGKTILGLQYIYSGVKLSNEKGIFISFEQSKEDLLRTAKLFDWDFKPLIKQGKLFINRLSTADFENNISEVINLIKENNIKRVVIDSISTLIYYLLEAKWEVAPRVGVSYHAPTINELKSRLLSLISIIKELGCTTIITSELLEGQDGYSRDHVSEFLCDGIIMLQSVNMGDYTYNSLRIPKMRLSDHSRKIYSYEIKKNKGFMINFEKEPDEKINI